jgi:hypothetical protein
MKMIAAQATDSVPAPLLLHLSNKTMVIDNRNWLCIIRINEVKISIKIGIITVIQESFVFHYYIISRGVAAS